LSGVGGGGVGGKEDKKLPPCTPVKVGGGRVGLIDGGAENPVTPLTAPKQEAESPVTPLTALKQRTQAFLGDDTTPIISKKNIDFLTSVREEAAEEEVVEAEREEQATAEVVGKGDVAMAACAEVLTGESNAHDVGDDGVARGSGGSAHKEAVKKRGGEGGWREGQGGDDGEDSESESEKQDFAERYEEQAREWRKVFE